MKYELHTAIFGRVFVYLKNIYRNIKFKHLTKEIFMEKDLSFDKTTIRVELNDHTTGVEIVKIEKTGEIEISEGF